MNKKIKVGDKVKIVKCSMGNSCTGKMFKIVEIDLDNIVNQYRVNGGCIWYTRSEIELLLPIKKEPKKKDVKWNGGACGCECHCGLLKCLWKHLKKPCSHCAPKKKVKEKIKKLDKEDFHTEIVGLVNKLNEIIEFLNKD